MSRRNRAFVAGVSAFLDDLAGMVPGAGLGSEQEIAARLGLSRTTVRSILAHLAGRGLIVWEGRDKRLLRLPGPADRPDPPEDPAAAFPGRFLGWILEGNVPPGTALNESELSRRFGVPVAAVRDFLIRFEPMGLIAKEPNRHWRLKGFTRAFATEMFEMRELIEMRAMRALAARPDRAEVAALAAAHRRILDGPEAGLAAFPALDARFHALVCAAGGNRFFDEFMQRISIIVHYHYQWRKEDEFARNRGAAEEHLRVLEAVAADRPEEAVRLFAAHLATARANLLRSVAWD
ncbi:GntR family transcriptional regulator [Mangrovicoccus algicola]|uniref:GntR family transcriptional regulator n=1 Tax=Mangrovicoccus algicola TaxID=2771008 RepID=A0A8J7D0D1_9RHOB|nr:GntR family transcriptional regulator [Mangrovicoccus algicola]MBE3639283.1 GntR family transcriptional regulator [Mangrovicoccus algicola]